MGRKTCHNAQGKTVAFALGMGSSNCWVNQRQLQGMTQPSE